MRTRKRKPIVAWAQVAPDGTVALFATRDAARPRAGKAEVVQLVEVCTDSALVHPERTEQCPACKRMFSPKAFKTHRRTWCIG